jgi:glucose-specific phosphotransferase system IIA component
MIFLNKKTLNPRNARSLAAVADGTLVELKYVPDEVFSKKVLGNGVAIQITSQEIVAPANGNIDMIYPHAFGITLYNGIQVLVHIGLNTVSLNGEGFQPIKGQGVKVKKGETIIKLDKNLIESKGYNLITMIVVTETNGYKFTFRNNEKVVAGKSVIAEF